MKNIFQVLLLLSVCATTIGRASGTQIFSDIPYGKDGKQTLDVYIPASAKNAPIILMVHGGAWRFGDKSSKAVVKNKVNHWTSKGFVFVSVNYRILPDAQPVEQTKDVARAFEFVQKSAHRWGGSPKKIILMGHSSGAHLVSLLSSNPTVFSARKTPSSDWPWLGTVSIDSAAYDVVKIMSSDEPKRFYKKAFGSDPRYWRNASPMHQIKREIAPFLAICSSQRKDDVCTQSKAFVKEVKRYGAQAELITQDLSHRKINSTLGKNGCYTLLVDNFLSSLHPSIGRMLPKQEAGIVCQ